MAFDDNGDRRKSATSVSTNKSFFARSIIKRETRESDQIEGAKGPLGLTTIYNPDGRVVADLIFVHGLSGGSQSTWTKNGNELLFWPREWLPKDGAFRDARIHSFGYSSGVGRESVLNVPDFARSLLASVHDSPEISGGDNVPLILIGHSMGGLVIKNAYILGHQIPEFASLVRRVCAIFFLATPHQGAHLADMLGRILAVAPGSRPFVHDLTPESPVLQAINEEFPRYCSTLQLFSFYENKPMNYGIGRGLIVEKHCAVMNYVNERKTYLDTNHRDIARFSSPNDPSYLAVRNALATTIEGKRNSKDSATLKLEYDQLQALNKFLGITDAPEDDITTQDSVRLLGSCEWFLQKDYFLQWRDAAYSKTLWVRGRPGAGKSVMSAHIVNHLREQGHHCCYFFFVEGDETKATINSFLRSMVWQMAMLHPEVLATVLDIAATWHDTAMNKVDHSPVWRRLFLRGILKIRLNQPQYWIIDALDECRRGSELMTLLTRVQELWPLNLLVTSRNSLSMFLSNTNPRIELTSETVLEEDANRDISLFLKANEHLLPANKADAREAMAEKILQASSGCFLWVSLVLKELRQVHTSAEIKKVLASSPSDMDDLYRKILADMENARFGKDLAKAILTWTTCSCRPLSTDEIHRAIELDIQDTVDDIERSIAACCGHLVYVDKRKRVHLTHLTAREFLTGLDLESEFAIDQANGHRRLALACLRYLSGSEMRASRPRKLSVPQDRQEKSPFADYACKYLFHHLSHMKSYDDVSFKALAKFLSSENVLCWIEHLASQSDLQRIYQAGKAINRLLNRRAQHTPPLGLRKELSLLDRWGTDLTHLVTKFGKQLSISPSSIHQVIPPFCPPDSALRRQFCSSHRGLSVSGLSAPSWDDCLSTINFARPARPLAVAVSDTYFALGMSTGKVIVYNDLSCQESHSLVHGEPVWCLTFSNAGNHLASAGAKSVRLWDVNTWGELFDFRIPYICMALCFTEEDRVLLGAIKNNQLMEWDVSTGEALRDEPTNWTRDFEEQSSLQFRRPTGASISTHQNLLAVVYRGEDILLWDFEQDRIHDMYEKETGSRLFGSTAVSDGSTTVWSLLFSPKPGTNLLAAAYSDGDLVVYDTFSGVPTGLVTRVDAQTLSCSPDGRTLASADARGTIQLFDFESLKLVYRLRFDDNPIGPKALAFTSDGRRLVDIRSNQCWVWDPIVLLREDIDDESSDACSISTGLLDVDFKGPDSAHITAIECLKSATIVFFGKDDGSVHVLDTSSKSQSQQLFVQSAGFPIMSLYYDVEGRILTCSDSTSRVVCREMVCKQKAQWEIRRTLFDKRADTRITNVLTSGSHSRLLIATEEHSTLWPISPSGEGAHCARLDVQEESHWVYHGADANQIILAAASTVKMFSWSTLEFVHSVSLETSLGSPVVSRIAPLNHSRFFISSVTTTSNGKTSGSTLQLWDFRDLNTESQAASVAYDLGTLSRDIEAIIGTLGDRLVFLHTNHWVCSAGLDSLEHGFVRHFFIPNDWMSLNNDLLLDIGGTGEIAFVKRAELAVIKRGLEITDKGNFSLPRKRSVSPRPGLPTRPAPPSEALRHTVP